MREKTPESRAKHIRRWEPKESERRAYVMLALLSIGTSALTFLGGVHYVESNNRKFCQIIDLAVQHPVPKPAHPKDDPSREHAYEGYQGALKLGKDLGCY